MKTTVTNAKIYTMKNREIIEHGFISFENGVITAIGDMADSPKDGEIFDAEGAVVTPGLVEAHCHIGMWEDGLNEEGDDGNEDTEPATPQMRAIDAVNPQDRAFSEAAAAGVTTVVTGPGSANPIGGQLMAMKTAGIRADDMVVKSPIAIKMAFGENPKMVYRGKERTPSTRMATAAIIRENLYQAREYMKKWERYKNGADEDMPEFDFKLEPLVSALKGEIQVHAHAHRADDIFTAIRIAKEFDLKLVLVHCTEGHLIADELAKYGYPVLSGPSFTDRSKPELRALTFEAPSILNRNNIPTAIITDHPETPIKYLNICAAMAVREGMDEYEALRAITAVPAEILGLDDKIGSLEAGKDADIVIWNKSPLDIMSKQKKVFINGKEIKASK